MSRVRTIVKIVIINTWQTSSNDLHNDNGSLQPKRSLGKRSQYLGGYYLGFCSNDLHNDNG
ncbi:hypothetical protein [Calothrix sp. NIES-3974]|uniref:hypothetical protein n=1 Tax=Calothrix sp. NIES-3974 TaxID=2005462 RepID=UPI0012FE27F1|nr:hypothetical protein [Calothrix sp. NIES-3974]